MTDAKPDPDWAVLVFAATSNNQQAAALNHDIEEMLRQLQPRVPRACFCVFFTGPDSPMGALYSVAAGGQLGPASLKHGASYDGSTNLTPRADAERKRLKSDEAQLKRRQGLKPAKAARLKLLEERNRDDKLPHKAKLLRQLLVERFTPDGPDNAPSAHPWKKASHTMLILWGHSQGVASALSPANSPLYTSIGGGGFGYSPITGEALTPADIARAIRAAQDDVRTDKRLPHDSPAFVLDLLAFDSCFMSTAEVAFELRGTAKYLLSSQSAIPMAGLDYTALGNSFALQAITLGKSGGGSTNQAREVASRILDQVGRDTDSPITLTLVDLEADVQSEMHKKLRALSAAILDVLGLSGNGRGSRAEWLRIRLAFETASWHRVRQFIDLSDLCYRLANYSRDRRVTETALDLMRSLDARPCDGGPQRGPECPIILETRSAPPWAFGGLSIYCAWLSPTPEEAAAGAWNAAVDKNDYSGLDLFAATLPVNNAHPRPVDSWACLVWHRRLMDEARGNALNRTLRFVQEAIHGGARDDGADGRDDGPPNTAEHDRTKPGNDSSYSDEWLYAIQARSQVASNPLVAGGRRRW